MQACRTAASWAALPRQEDPVEMCEAWETPSLPSGSRDRYCGRGLCPGTQVPLPSGRGQPVGVEVAVHDLTKSFGRQRIWGDVSLTLPPGEVSVFLGPSG